MNYRKFYQTEENIVLSKDYDVHHVDWFRGNNDITNLVHLPKIVHTCIHNYFGFVTKDECVKMREDYEAINRPERFTTQSLKFRLKKHINIKKCELSKHIKARLNHKQIEYQYNFR